jgi:hypothetical protein
MAWVSCDPGSKGALVVWHGEQPVGVCRLKSVSHANGIVLADFPREISFAVIEDVHSILGDGLASAFTFGFNVGVLIQFLRERTATIHKVAPYKWQHLAHRGLPKKMDTKQRSLVVAQKLFPEFLEKMDVKENEDGIHDALCLGFYWLVQMVEGECNGLQTT